MKVDAGGRDGQLWDADGIEVLIDPRADKSAAPDTDDVHVIISEAADLYDARGNGTAWDASATLGVDYAVFVGGAGYRVQLAIPWSALGVTPQAGLKLDGDLALNNVMSMSYATGDWAGLDHYAQPALWNAITLGAPPVGGGPGGNGGGDGGSGGGGSGGLAKAHGCSFAPGDASSAVSLALLASIFALVALLALARRVSAHRKAE